MLYGPEQLDAAAAASNYGHRLKYEIDGNATVARCGMYKQNSRGLNLAKLNEEVVREGIFKTCQIVHLGRLYSF